MVPDITVVIPVRTGGNASTTLASLERQTYPYFDVVVVHDRGKGACWARNQGLAQATTPFVLFSDDDIDWEPWGIAALREALEKHPTASYSYGQFLWGGLARSYQQFDAHTLRTQNFVSTMSLVRREHHPGWDENLKRLQDWDVWLTMLARGQIGIHCGRLIFSTERRNGISTQVDYWEADLVVRAKHGI